jgi:[protein-PII] uridylyltransferase
MSEFEARTAGVDAMVRERFPALPGLTLLAVGGYGRRELFPHSDIDLLILTDSEDRIAASSEPVAKFLQTLWDSGLRVSQSTRTVADCLSLHEGNLELTVSLLDQRFAAGDRDAYQRFAPSFDNFLTRRKDEITRRLVRLTRERHQKFQNTIFHLEPNIKDGPGGIRDFHVIRWINRLTSDGNTPPELAAASLVLTGLRLHLHRLSGRDNNVLAFDTQDRIAAARSIEPAQLMAEFYRAARRLQRAISRMLDSVEAQNSPLFAAMRDRWSRLSNADFSVLHGLIFFRVPQQAQADPDIVLRLFAFVARHGVRLSPDAGRRVHAHRAALARKLQERPGLWRDLHEILNLPHASLALREMHETELLTAVFPELSAIECLVVRDFYHLYTVDEHTLVAIEKVLALRTAEGGAFAELERETTDVGLLVLALLFHDSGKGGGAESHSAASARLAHPALQRIGVAGRDIQTVLFLIDAHLEMSAIMNTRDISDPATARALADRTGTVERLKLLTLLTYADISAVNPNAMTAWRGSLLWQLYLATYHELTVELQSQRISADTSETPERRAFLEGLPVRYLRTHSLAEIEAHMRMEGEGTAVALERHEGVYVLTLVTRDRPFLFASVAGVISSFGMDIVKAEAFSNARGAAVELFTFHDPIRTLELNPSEAEHLRAVVNSAALDKIDVNHLLARRPKRASKPLPPRVTIDESLSQSATLIEIVAEDRPGLLFDLASAISRENCSIDVVLINTEAHKAIDVFYVTHNRGKLPHEVSERLTRALAAPP